MIQTDDEHLVEAFLTRFRNKGTIAGYRQSLRFFLDWLKTQGLTVKKVRTPHLHLYRSYLDEINKPPTIAGKQGVVKRFFDYLLEAGEIRATPVPKDWIVRIPYRVSDEPRLSMEEIASVLAAAQNNQERLLISLSGLDGIKIQHIHDLTVEDVRFRDDQAVLVVKRPTTRIAIPLSQQSTQIVRDRIAEVRSGKLMYPDGTIDVGKKSIRIVRRLVKAAGVAIPNATPRILRKSYLKALADRGNLLEVVSHNASSTFNHMLSLTPRDLDGLPGGELLAQATTSTNAIELLAQARQLCDEQNITPIAPIVIAGAVLEMVLRHMCEDSDKMPEGKPGINAYSAALYRSGMIGKTAHSTNLANASLRNDAAHGRVTQEMTMERAKVLIDSVLLTVGGQEQE